jgi:hypothetical protein
MSRSKSIVIDGEKFDSLAEGRRWQELTLLQAAGEICNLSPHPRYELQRGFSNWRGERIRPIHYTGDFYYTEDNHPVVEDVKSPASKTQAYQIRIKLFQFMYQGIEFREVEA